MPKRITKTVYTFDELKALVEKKRVPGRVLEKVRGKLREWQTAGDWWDDAYEPWVSGLDQIGFCKADITFLLHVQGAGAYFTALVDVERLIDFLASDIKPKDAIDGVKGGEKLYDHDEDFRPWLVHKVDGVRGNHKFRRLLSCTGDFRLTVSQPRPRMTHSNAGEVALETYSSLPESLEPLVREFAAAAEDLRGDLCDAIYEAMEEEYEYLVSDEALADAAEANDLMFTRAGDVEQVRPKTAAR